MVNAVHDRLPFRHQRCDHKAHRRPQVCRHHLRARLPTRSDQTHGVRVGSRQGLLPWSRDRQTAQLNVRAERLASEGKVKEASNLLRRSLELNPSQPDVYRMQTQMGEALPKWPQRGLLNRVVSEAAQSTAMDQGFSAASSASSWAVAPEFVGPPAPSMPELAGPATFPFPVLTGDRTLPPANAVTEARIDE